MQKSLNFSHVLGDSAEDAFPAISSETLIKICNKYLTSEDTDFIYLILHGKRTKEVSVLLDVVPSEVVRRRRILTRKIRVIYLYHYRYNYIEFLKFASKVLYPDQLQCLILHYAELMSLQMISNHMGIQLSTAKRWLSNAKVSLEEAMENRPDLTVFLDSFEHLTYLSIKEIKRSDRELKKLNSTVIGKATLMQWITKKLVSNPDGSFKFN